jgi:hypothetical protein
MKTPTGRHFAARVASLAALAFTAGCGDTATSLDKPDALVTDAAAPDAFRPPLDALSPDLGGSGRLREFGEPCEEDVECVSGYCIEGPEAGRICTQFCGDCPAGYDCTLIGNTGADQIFVCTVDQPDLCKPCQTDRDCDDTEDLCLTIGNGQFCGEDCAADGLCPEGYVCADAFADDGVTMRGRQCIPAGGEGCVPCRDADGDGFGDGGGCRGADCDDADPTVYTGAPEVCDGRDNNCNSRADELELIELPVDLPDCRAQGVCAGSANRCRDGAWSCDYPATYEGDDPSADPDEQTCDLLDNDCDGQVDEGFDLLADPENCGLCGQICAFANAAGQCVDAQCERGPCDAGWNDADGNAGNGCEYLCVPSFGGVEVCDGLDNDCNGRIDEGFEGGEVCDGEDNDCDGQADEDWDLQTSVEHCGRCDRACAGAHAPASCEAGECVLGDCEAGWHDVDGNPDTGCEYGCFASNGGGEACDHIDNDCDGQTDEDTNLLADASNCGACGVTCDFLRATGACVVGECRIQACDEGFADADADPSTGCEYRCTVTNGGNELCDQLDNDCDGEIDEGIDLLTDDANCGRCDNRCNLANADGRCLQGGCVINECLGGFQDLDGLAENGCEFGCFISNGGLETCDGIDNDCDGLADEDFDLGADPDNCGFCGRACARPNADWTCDAGRCLFVDCAPDWHDLNGVPEDGCEFACVLQNGGVEICNGVDDDCDAQTDEGLLNACGQCGPTPDEVCDQIDNDCDGQTDEGLLNACGLCGPLPGEVCDFVDNDCDGQTDEGLRNRCNACGPEPGETCNGVDDDCDGLTDNHGVCGPYIQNTCRWFVGWGDENRGPDVVSNAWGECPFNSDKWYGDRIRCLGTRRDGLFMQLDVAGDMDDNDRLAFAFHCDDAANPGLADYIQTHCAVYLGYSDNDRGPDGTVSWGQCPPAINWDNNGLRCTSSGFDRNFRKINLEGDVDGNDDFAVAFKCVDAADPGRAWSLQQSADFFMGWADSNRGPGDGAGGWGPCPGGPAGEANGQRCTSTMGDGNFHRIDMAGDVNGDDDFGFALRARPAP